MENIYMNDQKWVGYDPSQWVLVASNRKMLFSANIPAWMDEQDDHGMQELENTMNRDKFVSDRFENAMQITAIEMADLYINKELAQLLAPTSEG